MSEVPTGVRSSMESPAVQPRPQALPLLSLGLVIVLLAGQPGFLGSQLFTTGAVLRGVLLLLATAAALFCAWTAPGPRMALSPARLALVLLPIGVALCCLPVFGGSLKDIGRYEALWLALACLPLGLLWTWSGLADATQTFGLLLAAGLMGALLVLIDALSGGPAVGPFGRTGVAGPLLAACAAAFLALPLRESWRGRRWMLLPAFVCGVACLSTRSRTGAIALVLGCLLVLALRSDVAQVRKRWRLAFVGAATLCVLLLGLMVEDLVPVPGSRQTVEVRLGLHRASLEAISERPLTGTGAGSYATTALRHRDIEEARLEPGRRAQHAHMDLLHAMVEGGVGAGVLFAAYLAALLFFGLRSLRGTTGPAREIRAAALGVLATLALAGLGDGILVDPAPVLLFAVAAGVVCLPRTPKLAAGRVLMQSLPLVLGLLALGSAYVLASDALSDRALMRYRHAIAGGVPAQAAERAARIHLEEDALRWRPDAPEALYRLGVHHATMSRYGAAKDAFRAAFSSDPGLTEARLDLSQVYQLQERDRDARVVLEEARRQDPTRYDVPRRVFEIEMGPEPVPGDPPTEIDELEVLRWMNLTASLAPDRFENFIDQARFSRRRATDRQELAQAGSWLRSALRTAPGDEKDPPAEVLIESFRLAEYEGKTSELFESVLLITALNKNPRPARRLGAEAARFLDIGQARADAALEAAGGDPSRVNMRLAQRAFDAATVRMTALLYAGQEDPEGALALARIDRDAGRFRRALARYRSLLAWTLPSGSGEQTRLIPEPLTAGANERDVQLDVPIHIRAMARQGDLLLEAASVAQRTDKALANFYRTRGQIRIGYELLLTEKLRDAARKFRTVLKTAPDQAEAHFGLARVLAREGNLEEAEGELIAALRLKPALRGPGRSEADLESLRSRPQVRLHLGLP